MDSQSVGIIGSGAWGSALAHALSVAGNEVTLWGRNAETINEINEIHENKFYLPKLKLDKNIRATTDLKSVCEKNVVIIAVPTQQIRTLGEEIRQYITHDTPIVCSAKGFELGTGKLISEILSETLINKNIAIISGPTFASEVINNFPTAATFAMKDRQLGRALARNFSSSNFRLYGSADIIGVQVGGAIKNIIAIACGIASGQGFGENTRAAIVTRGLAETKRLAFALGGNVETLSGLSGLGDFLLSCTSRQSRNFQFGEELGKGRSANNTLKNMIGIVEGFHSSKAVTKRAKDLKVDLPICGSVHSILTQSTDINLSIRRLLDRPIRSE